MNNEHEIVEDLKNWKEIIKPYATNETNTVAQIEYSYTIAAAISKITKGKKVLYI
jgi:hypothetical protein